MSPRSPTLIQFGQVVVCPSKSVPRKARRRADSSSQSLRGMKLMGELSCPPPSCVKVGAGGRDRIFLLAVWAKSRTSPVLLPAWGSRLCSARASICLLRRGIVSVRTALGDCRRSGGLVSPQCEVAIAPFPRTGRRLPQCLWPSAFFHDMGWRRLDGGSYVAKEDTCWGSVWKCEFYAHSDLSRAPS